MTVCSKGGGLTATFTSAQAHGPESRETLADPKPMQKQTQLSDSVALTAMPGCPNDAGQHHCAAFEQVAQ